MPKGIRAYRSRAVLARLKAGEVPEPYATALYLHGLLGASKFARGKLLELRIGDVVPMGDVVCLQRDDGQLIELSRSALEQLRHYLAVYLRGVQSEWLFPLPKDPDKPANEVLAKRYLSRLTNHPGNAAS